MSRELQDEGTVTLLLAHPGRALCLDAWGMEHDIGPD